ncbi:MAG: sigma-54-dependent Fis family transcriptional regulator [Gammaproteobacteria bacterium]|nr:MAG: sigma-54-dependent Fis family transcriptional regulator [Gammaproteobacteria bacterium]
MNRPVALIIDDEPDILELLEITLGRMGIETRTVTDIAGAMKALQNRHFDLCLTDMRLPDGNGIEIVRHVAAYHPQTPIAMITAHGNMDTAIEALKAGAFDFVSKPVELPILRRLIETALRLHQSNAANPAPSPRSDDRLLGTSPAIEQIRRLTDKLALSQAPVFIKGESGSGKEVAARRIHDRSPRAEQPFVAVNCGAIPAELMESELFGHLKGSFTGATGDKEGLFQAAHGGTLFLDEVADLPLSMQVKLLRAIQEKRIRPVGATAEVPIDVRLISASHKDMEQLVTEGLFRQDLYFRIHVIELNMPPLREHLEDLPVLTEHFLDRISQQSGQPRPQLSTEALARLQAYHYPGNVRELENILERACALCDGQQITPEDLGLEDTPSAMAETARQAQIPTDLETELERVERDMILKALEATGWNRTAAARQLGLTLRSLRYRMQKLGIDPEK